MNAMLQIEFGGPDTWPAPIDKRFCVPKQCQSSFHFCVIFFRFDQVIVGYLGNCICCECSLKTRMNCEILCVHIALQCCLKTG